MNAVTHHIKLVLEFKAQLFNYQDTTNELLIRSGLRLMDGYTLRFSDTSGTFENIDGKTCVDLHSIHRYIQGCPGLSLFGPNKYWSGGDIYLITVDDFVLGQTYQQEVVMKEPFKDMIELPFPIMGSWSLNLKLIKFGGTNQKAWQNYLDADYDAKAVDLLNQLPKDFGLPPILREYEFLKRVVSIFNQNKQQSKKMALHKIIRSQMPAYRQQLCGEQIKIVLFKQQSGNPLIYDFTDHCQFTPVVELNKLQKFKISFSLWKAFFTI